MISLVACQAGPGVRKPVSSLVCDEMSPATIESPLIERGARVALRQDGSLLVQVGLQASRLIGGQTVRKFEAFRMLTLGGDGSLEQVKATPSSFTPTFAPAPDYLPNAVVATVMHCDKEYYGFKYDEKGTERLRFLIGAFSAVKDIQVSPAGYVYVLAVAQTNGGSDFTLDDAGITLTKNYYDASFSDVLLAFDKQGNELWRRNVTELDGVGGGFGLVFDDEEDALFFIAARDAVRSPTGRSDTVVARYDIGVGLGQGQFILDHDVQWAGLRLGRDGALVAFGDVLTAPPALESRDVAVARVQPMGGVTEARFGSAEADFAFDATADQNGSVYVVGSRGGKLTDFGGDATVAAGFVMKRSGDTTVWSRAFADPAAGITLTSVDVAADGSVATAGITNASINGSAFEGGLDSIVFKLDSNGDTVASTLQCACGEAK